MDLQKISDLNAEYQPLIKQEAGVASRKWKLDFDDCFSVATEGLLRACRTFHPEKGSLPGWIEKNISWALLDFGKRERRTACLHKSDVFEFENIPMPEIADTTYPLSERYPCCNIFGLKAIARKMPWQNKHYARELVLSNPSSTWHFHTIQAHVGGTEFFTHTDSLSAGVAVHKARSTENRSRAGRENLREHRMVWTSPSSGSVR